MGWEDFKNYTQRGEAATFFFFFLVSFSSHSTFLLSFSPFRLFLSPIPPIRLHLQKTVHSCNFSHLSSKKEKCEIFPPHFSSKFEFRAPCSFCKNDGSHRHLLKLTNPQLVPPYLDNVYILSCYLCASEGAGWNLFRFPWFPRSTKLANSYI